MSAATAAMPQAPEAPVVAVPSPSVSVSPSLPAHPEWPIPLALYERIVESGIFGEFEGTRRVYLWEGRLRVRMTTYRPHSIGVRKVFVALLGLNFVGYEAETEAPMALRKADSAPEPDVKVVRGRCEDYNPRMPTSADVALVVEVPDTTLPKDRGLVTTYAVEEIPVYWLLNIPANRLEVYAMPVDGVYTSVQLLGPDAEVPVVLDGRDVGRVRVADLLP